MRWKIAAVVTTVLAAASVVARIELYRYDIVYGDESLTRLTLIAAALVAVALATVFHAWRVAHGAPVSQGGPDGAAALAALVAIAVALYSVLQLVFPSTPHQAAAAACRGVPLNNARALAQTTSLGANARTGAGSAYPTIDRFGSNCTIGVDGYCVGEPNTNSLTQLPDQRWLLVHDKHELVSAAVLRIQSPQSALGGAPAASCSQYDGSTGPKTLTWRATAAPKNEVVLHATAPGALLIGFAVAYSPVQAGGEYPYVNVGYYSPVPGYVSAASEATWKLINTPVLLHGTAKIIVAGEACYADDIPAPGTSDARLLTFTNGVLTKATDIDLATSAGRALVHDPSALAHQACSIR